MAQIDHDAGGSTARVHMELRGSGRRAPQCHDVQARKQHAVPVMDRGSSKRSSEPGRQDHENDDKLG